MADSQRTRPWRLIWHHLIGQLAFLVPVSLLLLFFFRSLFRDHLATASNPNEILVLYTSTLICIFAALFGLFIAVGVWRTAALVFPLEKLVNRARTLLWQDTDRATSAMEDLFTEEQAEWSELEDLLSGIGAELQRQSKQLLRERRDSQTLIAALMDPVVAVDRDRQVLFCNSKFEALFRSRKNLAKSRLIEAVRVPEVHAAFNAVLESGESQQKVVQLRSPQDETMHFYVLSVAPLKGDEPNFIFGAVGILHDISELKRAEQIRIDFVANVSHELRTPLTSIGGYTQTLISDFQKKNFESFDKYLQITARNVQRLMNLVEDLLLLSSLESGSELMTTDVNVRELSQEVIAEMAPRLEAKKLELVEIYNVEILRADAKRLEQVIVNLLDNAIKYVPAGKKIELRWEESADQVSLHVIDTGPGIAPEHLNRLFERFYRVEPDRSRESGGTGLGLAIVKHIVQRHGGSVQARSSLGSGSEFVCTFPRS